MPMSNSSLQRYIEAISNSGLSIYDSIDIGDPELWIPTSELEEILNLALKGVSLAGLPLRTRSKVVKGYVCQALGYPVPSSFRKTQPRFPGQFFDIFIGQDGFAFFHEDRLFIGFLRFHFPIIGDLFPIRPDQTLLTG